jgi:hypothetical protein
MLVKAYGTNLGAIGNMLRNTLKTNWKFDEDTMGMFREHVENNKYPTPPNPFTQEKKGAIAMFVNI